MSDNRVNREQKTAIVKRANGCCEYCKSQIKFAIQAFSVEHILPRSRGRTTMLDNLALSCQGCNNHKYNKTEGRDNISGTIASLYNPRQQKWNEHFAGNEDFTLVIRLTPTGRTTVETLQLNRNGVVNLRRVLYAMGEHPPAELNN
ncbi:MAG: HNH endonuclease [Nostoc sp. LLA-1]|nr:HNH endonuclease [Cyanocohniella sp. LLY]